LDLGLVPVFLSSRLICREIFMGKSGNQEPIRDLDDELNLERWNSGAEEGSDRGSFQCS